MLYVQTAPTGDFKSLSEWKAGVNTNDPSADQYSLLHLLQSTDGGGGVGGGMRGVGDNKFTFKLMYPQNTALVASGKNTIVWKQSSNPMTKTSGGTEGYEKVSLPRTSMPSNWGGLEYNTGTQSVLDGSTSSGNWWYAVGAVPNRYVYYIFQSIFSLCSV